MLQAHIAVRGRWHTLSAPQYDYALNVHWHETDPMVVLFNFMQPDNTHNALWRVGRAQLATAVVNMRHAGMGDIRLGPLTELTTLVQLTAREPGKLKPTDMFVEIPTKPLRQFVLETYKRVDGAEEQRALTRYINQWLTRIQA